MIFDEFKSVAQSSKMILQHPFASTATPKKGRRSSASQTCVFRHIFVCWDGD